MNKVERVLGLFWQLYNGLRINKDSFCLERGIDKRTFERDMEDVRNFLAEIYMGQDIVYDRKSNTYYMAGAIKRTLTEVEYTAIATILLGSRALRKDEMMGLLHSLEKVSEHSSFSANDNEEGFYKQYQENFPANAILKMQWDLYQCIKRRLVIRMYYLEDDKESNVIELIPKALFFEDNHFMLKAIGLQENEISEYFIEKIERFEILRNVNFQESRLYFNSDE